MLVRLLAGLGLSMALAVILWGNPPVDTGPQVARAAATGPSPVASPAMRDRLDDAIARTLAADGTRIVPPRPVIFSADAAPPAVAHDDFPNDGIEVRAATEPQASPAGRLRVEATRLNLRAGPGTGEPVRSSLPHGRVVEPIGLAEGGWQRVRDTRTGLEGWVAARFLR